MALRLSVVQRHALCDYSVGNGKANWGTGAAVGQHRGRRDGFAARRGTVGSRSAMSVSSTAGTSLPPDPRGRARRRLRPIRDERNQCTCGTNWRFASYDRAATRTLIKAIRAAAPGHVKLIYFNDPVLIGEGLTRWFAGHDDHLHVRYCEKSYPVPRTAAEG